MALAVVGLVIPLLFYSPVLVEYYWRITGISMRVSLDPMFDSFLFVFLLFSILGNGSVIWRLARSREASFIVPLVSLSIFFGTLFLGVMFS